MRHYFEAVHRCARHRYASLPEAIQAWWPALSHIGRQQFVAGFRAIEREHPYPAVEGSLETSLRFRRQQIPVALCTTNDRPMLGDRLRAADIDPGWGTAASTWESGHPKPDPKALNPIFLAIPVPERLEVGGIMGGCEIVGCVTASDSPWFSGPYGFVLRHQTSLPFVPLRGKLGFFRVPPGGRLPPSSDEGSGPASRVSPEPY
jgi:hypothetical protein